MKKKSLSLKGLDMPLGFNLEKIKFGLDEGTWQKAVDLYEGGKVKNFQDTGFTFAAKVQGTHLYEVIVSRKGYNYGHCTCYLGQKETLCKHMVAVAIYALKNGRPLTDEEKDQRNEVKFSGKLGELSQRQLQINRAEISTAMRYVKAYTGPSKTWFAYQDSLCEGCNRLASTVSRLPAGRQSAMLLIDLLLRLDKKLQTGGVDDSDGTVGGFMEEVVTLLEEFARLEPRCVEVFKKLIGKETCFGWEEKLLKLHCNQKND